MSSLPLQGWKTPGRRCQCWCSHTFSPWWGRKSLRIEIMNLWNQSKKSFNLSVTWSRKLHLVDTEQLFPCPYLKNKCYPVHHISSTAFLKYYKTRLSCFNVKTNWFMWNRIFKSKVYCMENVCWANEVQLMEYLNIWSTLLNINTG